MTSLVREWEKGKQASCRMHSETLYFSPLWAHWDCVHSSPWGSMLKFMSVLVLDGFEVHASWLVGPRRLGDPAAPSMHLAVSGGRDRL